MSGGYAARTSRFAQGASRMSDHNSRSSSSSSSSGIGFTGLLAVAFIVLKLTGFIDWSWFWVLSPIWIGIAIVLIAFFVYFMIISFR
jgi:hypothetical protein